VSVIHVLPALVAERIAEGEVVERPASVVKEPVANAIDAGATAIAVQVREGGLALIRVSDNGSGMPPEDAALSVERFATSKISSELDLLRVRCVSFRWCMRPAQMPTGRSATSRPVRRIRLENGRQCVKRARPMGPVTGAPSVRSVAPTSWRRPPMAC